MKVIKNWVKFNETIQDLEINNDIQENEIIEPHGNLTINAIVNLIKNKNIIKLQKLLDDGLDPNLFNKLPLRVCCLGSWESKNNTGESYFDIFKLFVNNGADTKGIFKWAVEYSRYDIIDYLAEKNDITEDDKIKAKQWLLHSYKQTEDNKAKILEYIENL